MLLLTRILILHAEVSRDSRESETVTKEIDRIDNIHTEKAHEAHFTTTEPPIVVVNNNLFDGLQPYAAVASPNRQVFQEEQQSGRASKTASELGGIITT